MMQDLTSFIGKLSILKRETKKGTVYDGRFRAYDQEGTKRHYRISGKSSEKVVKREYMRFINDYVPPLKKADTLPDKGWRFDDVVALYFAQLPNFNTESTIYDKEKLFERFIFPTFSGKKMNDLTKPALYAWQDNLWAMTSDKTGSRFSFKYKSKIRGHFNNFLDWAEARDYCTNALKTIPLPRNTDGHKEMQIWEECEFTAFIRAVDDIMWRAFFTMLYYTGVRVGELLALSDDCLKNNTLVVKQTIIRKTTDGSLWKVKSTKNKKTRTFTVPNPVRVALDDFLRFKQENNIPGDFLFLGSRPLPENAYQRALIQYCQISGVKKIRIHDFRHSFVSMLIHYGATIPTVASIIGDTNEQVSKTYSHFWETDKEQIMKTLGNNFAFSNEKQ